MRVIRKVVVIAAVSVVTLIGSAMGEVTQYRAKEIRPYQSTPVQPAASVHQPSPGARDDRSNRSAVTGGIASLLGTWRTSVAPAAWVSEDGAGNRYSNISPGAKAGDLVINPNGTYTWASYGGKRGAWIASSDSSYPLTLIDNVEHKQWKVGLDSRDPHSINVWDGDAYTYRGRR